jgi:hypothetical protein
LVDNGSSQRIDFPTFNMLKLAYFAGGIGGSFEEISRSG